jgi:glycopeptide antibiotics resistance protein
MIRSSGKLPQHVGPKFSVSLRLLLVWLCSALIITMAPFNFGSPADGGGYLQHAFLYGDFEECSPFHVVLNVLLFVPLGILLHHQRVRRRLPGSRIVFLTVATGLLISVVIECLQVFLPDRDSSLFDVGANTLGAIVGVIADRTAGQSVEQLVDRWCSRTTPRKLAGVMAGFLLVALGFAGALQAQTRLVDWSTEYPLMIGNELTRNRPWQGRVFSLEITDHATSYRDDAQLCCG